MNGINDGPIPDIPSALGRFERTYHEPKEEQAGFCFFWLGFRSCEI